MTASAKKTTDPRGLKRICTDCGARFYDLNKRPIVCPSCATEFSGEIKVKTRRGRVAAAVEKTESQVSKKTAKKEEAVVEEDEEEDDGVEVQIVSLDDLETTEKADDDEASGDVKLAEEDDDLDEIAVDDDIGDLNELEPDAEIDEDADKGEKDKKSKD